MTLALTLHRYRNPNPNPNPICNHNRKTLAQTLNTRTGAAPLGLALAVVARLLGLRFGVGGACRV